MKERRVDDNRIAELLVLTKQVHAAVFGNGKDGMKAEFEKFKGALLILKWFIGSGGIITIFLLIIQIIKYLK